jgi:Tat protein secretion system quality control protein TatD with DNase activity
MSSNLVNQDATTELYESFGRPPPAKILAAYGLHPWFCHAVSLAAVLPSRREHYEALFDGQAIPDGLIDRLPEPRRLPNILHALERNLVDHPDAMVGEIGLDKSFRLPDIGGYIAPHSMKPDERADVSLTQLKTPMAHQVAVCEAQVDVAVRLRRPASLHCVTAQGPMLELMARLKKRHGERFDATTFDMHSLNARCAHSDSRSVMADR